MNRIKVVVFTGILFLFGCAPVPAETPIPTVLPLPTLTITTIPSDIIATPEVILSDGVPDTPEAQDIVRTIQRAAAIETEALWRTHDLSKYQTVFINDPRFPASLETVRRLGHNPSLQSAGWLDYKMAYDGWSIEEESLSKTRHPASPEPTRTVLPGAQPVPAYHPRPLVFQSISINGDIAIVVVDTGRIYEDTLVLMNGQWYIAKSKALSGS